MTDHLAMLRIEFKLDLILHALKNGDPVLAALLKDGDAFARYADDTCPVCEGPISLTFSPAAESFTRDCACRPPFAIVPGISKLLTPPPPPKNAVLHLDRSGGPDVQDNEPPQAPTPVPGPTTPSRGTVP